MRALADALPDALFTIDLDGRVTYWNRAAQRITGWSPEEALGRDCSILAGDAVRGCSCGVGPLRCGLAESGRTSKTCTLRTKDGRLLLIVKNAVPLYDGQGRLTGALESFTEVGEEGFEPRCDWRPAARGEADFCGIVGRHPTMAELFQTIGLVAQSNATVMILGESGSGKECVAEAIHRGSRRATGPFVRVSCSALNENLLESELFGHVKGAFTGAVRDRRGRFQEAHGGTLLLDEIGDVSPAVQVKLLRVIEQREIERVGDSMPIKVDVRLICATHRDLKGMVDAGRFRADLYFRLAVFPIRVPSLREHVEDIPLLADAWMARFVAAGGTRPAGISPLGDGRPRGVRMAGQRAGTAERPRVRGAAIGGRRDRPPSPSRRIARAAANGEPPASTGRGRSGAHPAPGRSRDLRDPGRAGGLRRQSRRGSPAPRDLPGHALEAAQGLKR